ncbi:MAG TPA: VIT domain-containing protein [Kofleriaceae bacterium]|nr:VIT domain-containing protein [Kofleriaceae bacterium]
MKSESKTKAANDGVLEHNVSTLLEAGGEPPRIADAARTRIRAQLVDKFAAEAPVPARSALRRPLIAVGLGLAVTAAGALVVTKLAGGPDTPAERPDALADGSSWITGPGGKVEKLGDRHVRVEGAALLDVAPGKGTFVVDTARGRIEVVGTRFLVDAHADRTTAAVVRGSVKLASTDGFVLLHAGEQGVAEPGRPPTRGPAPRLSSLVSWAAQARRKAEGTIDKPVRNGTLFAREPNNPWVPEAPLPIAKLGVDIVVEDQVARVAIDQTFHNPSPRVMEGMYRFAIPPDASLQRLAMYVDGKLTESAVVERMQARRIYEDVVYRRLDPALLEWAGTGRLSLRVYPLPANADKRVVLAYTQSLPKLYDDYTLTVPLPEVDLPVGELGFDVRMKGCANCEITSPSHAIQVKRTGDDAIVAYQARKVELGDSLVLHVRDPRKQAIVTTAQQGSDHYLLVRARPELPRTAREYRPRTWVILDDVSASRDELARKAQADLVDAFLRELDENDKVAIVAFDVEARKKLAPTRVLDVDRKAVRAALAGEGGVGATDFGVALDAALPLLAGVAPDDAMIVYLGDGVITSGPRQLDAIRGKLVGKAHFVGVGVGDGPDTQTLDALAAATAGYATTIDLADDVGWRAFDLVAALHTTRVTGIEAKLVDGSGTLVPATAYVKTPQLADGEELELVAKLAGSAQPLALELTGTVDGKPWQQRVALDAAGTQGGYLPRLWAQRHIAARLLAKHDPIVPVPCAATVPVRTRSPSTTTAPACKTEVEQRQERDEAIRKEVVELGKKFFLLSRHTSLLVLEDDAMYKKYGVEKGRGDTWAPYVLPAKLAVATPSPTKPADIADDALLVRRPLQVFTQQDYRMNEPTVDLPVRGDFQLQLQQGGYFGTRNLTAVPLERKTLDKAEREVVRRDDDELAPAAPADDHAEHQRTMVYAEDLAPNDPLGSVAAGRGESFGIATKVAKGKSGGWSPAAQIIPPQRLGYPSDPTYDDLTSFIPALVSDEADRWRDELMAAAGGAKTHPIDDGARTLLEQARRSLPAGIYRWDGLELAVDAARKLGWKRTTGTDLVETASLDGTAWTRRYGELGIDVTRSIAEDDLALAWAYLPLWVAEPAHYARWFEVRLRDPRTITLSRTIRQGTKTEVSLAYTLEFDDQHRLVAMRDADGDELLRVTWSATGPTAARIQGRDIALGFSPVPVFDAVAWAHGNAAPGVAIEMPMHVPGYWEKRAAAVAAGSAEWRHAQRQRLASLAAIHDHANLFATYEALRTHGGVELGDLALASSGLPTSTTDAQFAAAIAPLEQTAIARYLQASRLYSQRATSERIAAQVSTGFIGALWTVREVTALLAADKNTQAIDRLLALGDRAFDLRLVAASATTYRYQMKPADLVRAWDSIATGRYRNVARAQAIQVLAQRGQYDAAAERVVALVDQLDLAAPPPNLQQVYYYFHSSRRGTAGWQLVWTTWRDKVLASSSFDHVVALLFAATGSNDADVQPILARAAQLAGDDVDRVVYVAQFAANRGQQAFAQRLIDPLVKQHPTRELHLLAGRMALQQGRPEDALAHFEAAQTAGGDEAVPLSTLESELAQLIAIARQVAVQSTGPARQRAVQKALAWGAKWRAIDPNNRQVDQVLGELLLAVGDKAGAWRQLSTVIERDPMSGEGYQTVAQAFEAQGRVADAITYWHQAAMLEQTNPTARLREAQALIALGRTQEGDALLAEIAGKKWHERYEGIGYQARELLERGKRARGDVGP